MVNMAILTLVLNSIYLRLKIRINKIQRPLVNPDKTMWPKIESGLSKE
jgi:hypothetical protein